MNRAFVRTMLAVLEEFPGVDIIVSVLQKPVTTYGGHSYSIIKIYKYLQ